MFRLLISVFTVFTFVDATTLNTEPALLVISFDGFKPDYLHRNVTPNLNQFRKDGVSAGFMLPVFPTKTFVNHFSIATVSIVFQANSLVDKAQFIQQFRLIFLFIVQGLYPGNHGVLANDLYDSKFGQLKYSYELFHYNDSTIPIWASTITHCQCVTFLLPFVNTDLNKLTENILNFIRLPMKRLVSIPGACGQVPIMIITGSTAHL